MQKWLACLLSFVLLFSSSAPSFAQSKGTRDSMLERGKAIAEERMQGQTWATSESTHVSNKIKEFDKALEAKMSTNSQSVMNECQEVAWALGLDPVYEALGIKTNKSTPQKDTTPLEEQEAKNLLKDLSKRIYQAHAQEKDLNSRMYLRRQAEMLFPVFKSMGALDPTAQKWAAGFLRLRINKNIDGCKKHADMCDGLLANIGNLLILNNREDYQKDSAMVKKFLEANYQSAHAASVLQTSAVALLSMDQTDLFINFLLKVGEEDLGFWDRLGNVASLEYWSEKVVELMKFGTRWVSRANDASYYTVKTAKGSTFGNVYQDLGYFLATEKQNGKPLYRAKVQELLPKFLQANDKGVIAINLPPFVYGALMGGMTVPGGTSAAVQKRLNQLHTNLTGLVLFELYLHPKAELANARRITMNNMLVDRYEKVVPKVNGKVQLPKGMVRKQVTATTIFKDEANEGVVKTFKAIDIVLAVIAIPAGGAGIAKLAAFGVKSLRNARSLIAVARGQKVALNVSQLRLLAQYRNIGRTAKATAQAAADKVANVGKALTDNKVANTVKNTVKGSGNTAKGGTNMKVVSNNPNPQPAVQVQEVKQTADGLSILPGTTPRLGIVGGTAAPTTLAADAVPAQTIQMSLSGPLDAKVAQAAAGVAGETAPWSWRSALSTGWDYTKFGATYAKDVGAAYFTALTKPRRTLQMSVLGPLGGLVPESGAFGAALKERRAVTAAKTAAKVAGAGEEAATAAKTTAKVASASEEASATRTVAEGTQAAAATAAKQVSTTVTPENYLSAKRVGVKYEVQAIGENGQVFTREMTTTEYMDLRTAARSTGKKETLELRGQRNQLQMRRAAAQANAAAPAAQTGVESSQIAASQIRETAETATQEIAAHFEGVKKVSTSADRVLSNAQESRSAIVAIEDNALNTAEPLYTQVYQSSQEIDRLYVEINELQRSVKTAGSVAEITEKTALASQKAKRAQQLFAEMEKATQQLRQLEMNTSVKAIGRTRVTAQRKLAEVRKLLQTANEAKIPRSQTEQLRKALQQAEQTLYSTEGVPKEALALGREGNITNAIDKAQFAQRQIESALRNVEESINDFKQMWRTELNQVASQSAAAAGGNAAQQAAQGTDAAGKATAGNISLQNISSVGNGKAGGVYPLINNQGKTVAYAKLGQPNEIARTRQVQELIDGNKIRSGGIRSQYSQIEIEYPQIITEDLSNLPSSVQKTISQDLQQLSAGRNSKAALANNANENTFVMSAVDTEGSTIADLRILEDDVKDLAWNQANPSDFLQQRMNSLLLEQFNNRPITQAEWQEVEKLFDQLHQAGFQHGDLGQNLFLRRNPQTGKLKVTLIDFEVSPGIRTDANILDTWKKMLQQYQVLQ